MRTISTRQERDALEEGAVVMDSVHKVLQLIAGGWWCPGEIRTYKPALPARVLWDPRDGEEPLDA